MVKFYVCNYRGVFKVHFYLIDGADILEILIDIKIH